MVMKVGYVVHSLVKDIFPSKNKFAVCINPQERLFLLINTENRSIYECVEVPAETYSFLKGQSRYIGCAKYFHIPEPEQKETIKGYL